MKECGSRCVTRLFEGQKHGFFNKGAVLTNTTKPRSWRWTNS